ncbi:MAG: cache domain-containing protein [Nitrososphaeraceae archaeon]
MDIEEKKNSKTIPELIIIKDIVETKLSKLSSLLDISSTLPQMKNYPLEKFIDKTVNGIPENFDPHKRQLAKEILSGYKELSLIGFILPTGDVYMYEPFDRQENLTTSNLGFRDYFKESLNTGKTYLSDVIVSKSAHRSLIVLATPVFYDNQTIGIIIGTINLDIFDKFLQSISIPDNYRILILDKNGVKLGDSDANKIPSISNKTVNPEHNYSFLKSFKNAVDGDESFLKEKIDNNTAIISYVPYSISQNTGVILLVQECLDMEESKNIHSKNIEFCDNVESKMIDGSSLLFDKQMLVELLSLNIMEYIQNAETLLYTTSKLPQITENIKPELINSTINGINNFEGMEKRDIAKSILSNTTLFESVFLLLDNGDMYLDEPFYRQENLTRDNFAIRDYYKQVTATKKPSLGNSIVSAATGKHQANLAVPIFSEKDSLVGIWAGGLNLTSISEIIQNFNITKDEKELVLYLDGNGSTIGVSNINLLNKITNNTEFDFSTLQSFIRGSQGNSGYVLDTILDKKYEITYHPVKIIDKTWLVLLISDIN